GPVRFMELPQAHHLAAREPDPEPKVESEPVTTASAPDPDAPPSAPTPERDPLGWLAEAAGYSDGERWWEHMVEQRHDSLDLFAGIAEAMTALRAAVPPSEDPVERQREAFMRQTIRAAQKDGFERIAVVCGAWHVPALSELPAAGEDVGVLKGLPAVRVQATW